MAGSRGLADAHPDALGDRRGRPRGTEDCEADYESVTTLLTEWLYIAAQMPHGTHAQQNVFRAAQRVAGSPPPRAPRCAAPAALAAELRDRTEATTSRGAAERRRTSTPWSATRPPARPASSRSPGRSAGRDRSYPRADRVSRAAARPSTRSRPSPRSSPTSAGTADSRPDRLRPHPPAARRRPRQPRRRDPLLEQRLLDLRARPLLAPGLRALPAATPGRGRRS